MKFGLPTQFSTQATKAANCVDANAKTTGEQLRPLGSIFSVATMRFLLGDEPSFSSRQRKHRCRNVFRLKHHSDHSNLPPAACAERPPSRAAAAGRPSSAAPSSGAPRRLCWAPRLGPLSSPGSGRLRPRRQSPGCWSSTRWESGPAGRPERRSAGRTWSAGPACGHTGYRSSFSSSSLRLKLRAPSAKRRQRGVNAPLHGLRGATGRQRGGGGGGGGGAREEGIWQRLEKRREVWRFGGSREDTEALMWPITTQQFREAFILDF